MRDTKEIIQRLNLRGKALSKGHKRIAEYIAQHYEKAVFMTAAALGAECGVSESTVVRFASAMGYEGFPELREALSSLVRQRLTSEQRFASAAGMEQHDVLATVLRNDEQNIRKTIEAISQQEFDEVVLVSNTTGDVFEEIARISEKDVLVGISYPRYSSRTLECMRFARQNGAQVIGLTDGEMSPLHDAADLCLCACTDMASFVDSLAAPLSVINALVLSVGLHRREELAAHFKRLEGIWNANSVYINKENE